SQRPDAGRDPAPARRRRSKAPFDERPGWVGHRRAAFAARHPGQGASPMDTTQVVILIIVVVLLLVAVVAGLRVARRKRESAALRDQFGPEYDATVGSRGDRQAAERDLADRRERR